MKKGFDVNIESCNDYAVFTVTNLAYLPKALVLAESLLKYNKVKLHIYIVDRKVDVDLPESCAEFIWIEDVGFTDLYELAFKYDITEFSTSLKPGLTLKLLEKYQKVIFLDPDTCLYHSVAPILNDLDEHAIVLTPHYTIPHSNNSPDSDIGMLRFGSFNLGFYAVRNSEQAIYFLNWWGDRCRRFCYFETQFGLSTDQKWVSIAPCFFQDLYVSFNLGYNVAFWNLNERQISKDMNDNYFVNDKYPLIFFHFSSFDEGNPELLSKRSFNRDGYKGSCLVELALIYKDALIKNKKTISIVKYGFDYMSNGDYISPTLRRAYACVGNELPDHVDPFDSVGPVGLFAKRNHLICKSHHKYSPEGSGDMSSYKKSFLFVNFIMRIILRLLGPNKFSNFSRLLVYLSSYRQNRGLWKI
ncbi:MAG: hypothetical protein ABFS18_01310 [Thermodesulfobacteriota bacterium]